MKIYKWVKYVFVVLYPLTLASLLVETYTYKYFLFKHLYLNTDILLGLIFILSVLIIYKPEDNREVFLDSLIKLYLSVSKLSFIILSVFYLSFQYVNKFNYPNFVFSRYHIQPGLLIRPIILCLFFVARFYIKNKFEKSISYTNKPGTWRNLWERFFSIGLLLLIIVFGVNNLISDMSNLFPNVVSMVKLGNSSYENRYKFIMNEKYGYYYNYMEFVRSVVPEKGSILLPPQKNPWQLEGNQRLDRFFLYPRTLYSAGENDLPGKYDYILIAWGSDTFPPASGSLYGWPNYNIQAKHVYIYDSETNGYTIYSEDYKPSKFLKAGTYGLIETK